jgi:CDP-diacylglycerol pyrophosphatase
MLRPALFLAFVVTACAAPEPPASRAPNPNGLYDVMRTCLAQTVLEPPCTAVDRTRGYVVIKDDDPAKPLAWLIVPDREVTGIEDQRALIPPVVDFWSYGWFVGSRLLTEPPESRGLAINSKQGRSQDLLHIHISCVLPEVEQALAAASIGPDWAVAPFVQFRGHAYNARRVPTLDPSPFLRLLELPGARERMAEQSLAVIGAPGGGFYLLTDATEPGVVAEAEELLDQSCGR